jgi:hypothetical protein
MLSTATRYPLASRSTRLVPCFDVLVSCINPPLPHRAMHTAFLRANVVFFFALTLLFVLSLGCAAQYYASSPTFPCAIVAPQIARLSDDDTLDLSGCCMQAVPRGNCRSRGRVPVRVHSVVVNSIDRPLSGSMHKDPSVSMRVSSDDGVCRVVAADGRVKLRWSLTVALLCCCRSVRPAARVELEHGSALRVCECRVGHGFPFESRHRVGSYHS